MFEFVHDVMINIGMDVWWHIRNHPMFTHWAYIPQAQPLLLEDVEWCDKRLAEEQCEAGRGVAG